LLAEEVALFLKELRPFLKENTLFLEEVVFFPKDLGPFLKENLILLKQLFCFFVHVVFRSISFVI
jgi:hypothetical protein